jgi:hypothetical protein
MSTYMVHISTNVHICQYMSIHVHMCAYMCIYRRNYRLYPKSGRVSRCMTSTDPCMQLGPTPAASVAGYWQLAADTCNMDRYEQDMCMYVSAQICGGDINEIQLDTNRYKQI